MAEAASPETGKSLEAAPEQKENLIVSQPKKLEGLMETITLIDNVSERIGEDRSGDLGAHSGGTAASRGKHSPSWREQAIAELPKGNVMEAKLKEHIEHEVKELQKEVRRITRAGKPGNAYKINQMYARMRRLNGILHELAEATYDVVKRLYIRIFVDKQKIS